MKLIKSKIVILSLVFMSLIGINSASAVEGLSIGLGYNYSGFMGTGKETKTGSGADTSKADITIKDGAFTAEVASIFAEYAVTDIISLGFEAMAEDMSTPTNTNVQDNNIDAGITNNVKATFENHTTLYANINMPYNTYFKVGYHMVDVLTEESLGTGGKYGNTDTTGYTVGLGYNYKATGGIFVRAELSGSQYEDISATNSVDTTKQVHVSDMYGATASIKIGKTF